MFAQAVGVVSVKRVLSPHIASSTDAFGVVAVHACGAAEVQIVSATALVDVMIVEHE